MQIILSALGWILNTAGLVQKNIQLEMQPMLEWTGAWVGVYIKNPSYLFLWPSLTSSLLHSSTYLRNISPVSLVSSVIPSAPLCPSLTLWTLGALWPLGDNFSGIPTFIFFFYDDMEVVPHFMPKPGAPVWPCVHLPRGLLPSGSQSFTRAFES